MSETSRLPRVSTGPLDAVALLVVLFAPTVAAWFYFIQLEASPWAGAAYGATKTLQFLLPILFLFWLLPPGTIQLKKWTTGRWMLWAVLSGLLASAGMLLAYVMFFHGGPVTDAVGPAIAQKLEDFHISDPGSYLLMSIFLSFIHSGLEEYYWRWFVFGALRRRMGFTPALLIGSLGFTSHHVLVIYTYVRHLDKGTLGGQGGLLVAASLAVFLAGAFWCWLYERSGRLQAAWLSHVLVDLALMSMGAMMIWG